MEYSFDVKMKPKYMIQFLLRHTYRKFSGFFGVLISLGAFLYLCIRWGELSDQSRAILGILAALFTVINPLMLCDRAAKQVKANPCYQQAISYTLAEAGITTAQGDGTVLTPWNNIRKIIEMREQLVVYTSPVHAFLFPYESMNGEKNEIVSYIKEHIV